MIKFCFQVTYMGSMKNHGLSVIDFRRSMIPSDEHDAPIPLEGPTQVSPTSVLLEIDPWVVG